MGQENKQLQPIMPTGVATPAVLPEELQPYSPTQLSVTFSEVKTVEQALAVKAPSFGTLVRQGKATKDELERLIMQHLVVIDAYLKQKNGLQPQEIESIAEEVVAKYYWVLTFADINIIFRKAMNGEYGELYNTITASKVLDWFAEYERERSRTAYNINRNNDREDSTPELVDRGYKFDQDGNITGIDKKMREDWEGRHPNCEARKEARFQVWKEINKDRLYDKQEKNN